MIKKSLKSFFGLFNYQLVKNNTVEKSQYKNMDSEFIELYEECAPYTMTTIERMYALYSGLKYIVANKIPGDIVECGVWKGGSSMLCALTLAKLGDSDRKLLLYDTYTGMPKPIEKDKEAFTGNEAMSEWSKNEKGEINEWCYASLEEVQNNMFSTGYPKENISFIKGKVEETIPNTIPDHIALLRLDTDLFESTKHELIHLYPKLSKLGVLVIDDYGYWAGAREAVDDYLNDNSINMLLHRIDQTGRIAIKS